MQITATLTTEQERGLNWATAKTNAAGQSAATEEAPYTDLTAAQYAEQVLQNACASYDSQRSKERATAAMQKALQLAEADQDEIIATIEAKSEA